MIQLKAIPNVASTHSNLNLNNPSFNVKLDHNKMALLKITPQQVANALQLLFSDLSAGDFNKDNILYNVKLTTDVTVNDVSEIYLTTTDNNRISLGSIVQLEPIFLPRKYIFGLNVIHIVIHKNSRK